MSLKLLKISGSALITPPLIEDQRGFFSPLIGQREFDQIGLSFELQQINSSLSTQAHTLRGLHMQSHPASETKVIRVLSGALWDVMVDLRPTSPSYQQWTSIELCSSNREILVIPPGCAHGFLTLEANTEIIYLVDKLYQPEHEVVIRWNDPFLDIPWPHPPVVISEKDRTAPDFNWT